MKNIEITYLDVVAKPLSLGNKFTMSLYATEPFSFGAVTMYLELINNLKVTGVRIMKCQSPGNLIWTTETGKLIITWYDEPNQGITHSTDDAVIEIDYEVTATIPAGALIKLVAIEAIECQFGTPEFEVIPLVTLASPVINATKATQSEKKAAQGYTDKPVIAVCKYCKKRTVTRCSLGGFVTAANGVCKLYQAK